MVYKVMKFKTDNQTVLSQQYIKTCLVFDIETDSLQTATASCKFFGAYSYLTEKYYIIQQHETDKIQQLIDKHKVLIGFNNNSFDIPILNNETNQINTDYKICFDCFKVLYDYDRKRPNREQIINWKGKPLSEQLPNRKLKTIAKVLEFDVQKGDIDYKIFQKNIWSNEELKLIEKYLYSDVNITRQLFEFYVTYFDNFKHYVNEDNIRKFNYIKSSPGSFAYSAFCHMAGLPFEFEDDKLKRIIKKQKYKGGFVLEPKKDYVENCLYLDYISLYPMIYMQCNLFSDDCDCCTLDEKWSGNNFFDIEGKYCSKKRGKIENLLLNIFMKRKEYTKNKDGRAGALKLMLNTLYGISSSPIFKSIHRQYCASDCTSIGRKMIKYTIQQFNLKGYPVIYADTDSCFVDLNGGTKEEALRIANDIVKKIQSHLPFPSEEFYLKIDDEFDKLWLHKKKMYIGINKTKKLVIKGHAIKKTDASQLGRLIFKKLRTVILSRDNIKFDKDYIKNMVDEEIHKDITLVGQFYNVRPVNSYKNLTGLHAQIANKLGEGLHLLIPNKTLGKIGKSKKYATVDEVKDLTVSDLLLDKVWSELSPFVEDYYSDKDMKKAMKQYEKNEEKMLSEYFDSDLFDSDVVGDDINNKEYLENEKFFGMQ